ncbi:hypothetical protein TcWFU_000706 [Taenia crassiceps]|uniref:C2H2-type domain-containing protein n=1 Tax=Taenia crassiceps TaxID=6207 RepID=A0ABR4Q3R9_9CEST
MCSEFTEMNSRAFFAARLLGCKTNLTGTLWSSMMCRECQMNFSSKKLLDAHYSLNHGDGVINYCNECERLFSSVTSLRRHNRVVHQQHLDNHPLSKFTFSECIQELVRRNLEIAFKELSVS